VAQVAYSARSLDSIERAFQAIRATEPAVAGAAVAAILSGIANLATHPLVGRRLQGELRELVISCGPAGFVALYRFEILRDEVYVLAIRQQRELGFVP
jgi:plasmid stabilization system protein ParE